MVNTGSRRRLRTRGEPVFAFIDPDVSDQPFLVDRVPFTGSEEVVSLVGGLLSLFWSPWGGSTPTTVIYVTDPAGEVFEVVNFESEVRETEWVARARDVVVASGAAGLAELTADRSFRERYGPPTA